jgi:hypothetical protein
MRAAGRARPVGACPAQAANSGLTPKIVVPERGAFSVALTMGSAAATPLTFRSSATNDSGRPLSAAPVTSNAALP